MYVYIVCRSRCRSICLPTCPSVSLPARSSNCHLPVCLSVFCLYVCVPVHFISCLSVCLPAWLPVCVSAVHPAACAWLAILSCQYVYMSACLFTCLYLSAYLLLWPSSWLCGCLLVCRSVSFLIAYLLTLINIYLPYVHLIFVLSILTCPSVVLCLSCFNCDFLLASYVYILTLVCESVW